MVCDTLTGNEMRCGTCQGELFVVNHDDGGKEIVCGLGHVSMIQLDTGTLDLGVVRDSTLRDRPLDPLGR